MKRKIALLALFFAFAPALTFAQSANNDAELSALLGGLVKSDSWIIRKDKAEEEFIGNVKYENEIYKISADRALSQRKLNAYTISGNVQASRKQDGEEISLKANKVFFNAKKDYGYAQGSKSKQAELSFSTPNNTFNLYADKINFGKKFTSFEAEGDCELNDMNNTLYAGKMTYDTQSELFTASEKRPVLFGYNEDGDYALQGDQITADNKNGIFKASGRVTGWLVPAEDISKYTQGQKDGAQIF